MASQIVNEYRPDKVSPPGETLEEILEERGMTQAELADRTGRPKKTINEIIQGKAALTCETALQLERVLGIPATFWLTREQQYRAFLARRQDEQALAAQVAWLDETPVQSMIKAGWIAEREDKVGQLREVLSFYAIASPEQYASTHAIFRRTKAFQSNPATIAAWLRQGERLAQQLACTPYNERVFRATLEEARQLTCASFATARTTLPQLCAAAGVAVVIVPELPQTRVCGVTRWLSPKKALIQLSLHYKTDDQFWFTFFHEAGHIVLHGKREAFLDEDDGADEEREQEANRFAMDVLIPPAELRRFRADRGNQHISQEMVVAFAKEIGIAAGIVVGRLQHEGDLPRTHLNDLKRSLDV
jgi:addiction module HigA family antidote